MPPTLILGSNTAIFQIRFSVINIKQINLHSVCRFYPLVRGCPVRVRSHTGRVEEEETPPSHRCGNGGRQGACFDRRSFLRERPCSIAQWASQLAGPVGSDDTVSVGGGDVGVEGGAEVSTAAVGVVVSKTRHRFCALQLPALSSLW